MRTCVCFWHFLYLVLTPCPWWLLNFAWLVPLLLLREMGIQTEMESFLNVSWCSWTQPNSPQSIFSSVTLALGVAATEQESFQCKWTAYSTCYMFAKERRYSVYGLYKKMSPIDKKWKTNKEGNLKRGEDKVAFVYLLILRV